MVNKEDIQELFGANEMPEIHLYTESAKNIKVKKLTVGAYIFNYGIIKKLEDPINNKIAISFEDSNVTSILSVDRIITIEGDSLSNTQEVIKTNISDLTPNMYLVNYGVIDKIEKREGCTLFWFKGNEFKRSIPNEIKNVWIYKDYNEKKDLETITVEYYIYYEATSKCRKNFYFKNKKDAIRVGWSNIGKLKFEVGYENQMPKIYNSIEVFKTENPNIELYPSEEEIRRI